MENVSQNDELTSTLHLGLRSVVDASPQSALNALWSSLAEADKTAIEAVLNGDPEKAMVVVHRGSNKGSRYLIAQGKTSIGRSPESEIFLDDVTVSRSHAVIEGSGSVFALTDLGSLNGTYINNQSLKSSPLNCGDEIQIGKFHLIFVSARKTK
jgi:pSer/pThr/pTyr-binding forkhead associated (FHA) protein